MSPGTYQAAEVHFAGRLAGRIWKDPDGYHFAYDADYLQHDSPKPVSLTLPLQSAPYTSRIMFPFFDGLIPEGWLLEIAELNWKLNPRDRFGLLLACCRECIGAVSIHPIDTSVP